MYKAVTGFKAATNGSLPAWGNWLPLSDEDYNRLLGMLADDQRTRLMLADGRAREVVLVVRVCGRLVMFRGQEGTSALPFRCGTLVEAFLGAADVRDIVCQMTDADCAEALP